MEGDGPLCLECADLGHLVFLAAGDAAVTRRAKKGSGLAVVVGRFSRSRGRYERQGLLVEEEALDGAEVDCLADEVAKERRRLRDADRRRGEDDEIQDAFRNEIIRLFPGCPGGRAKVIAVHAGTRSSGRVGRSSAGRALDLDAVTLAVVASVRHEDTDYDQLLMSGMPRAEARHQARSEIQRILDVWRAPEHCT